MGMSWDDLRKLLDAAKQGRDVVEGLSKLDQATQNLKDACDAWEANPTPENEAKVQKANQDWYHTPAENVGDQVTSLAPKGVGDLANRLGIPNPLSEWLKGLQDSPGNPVSQDRLEQATKLYERMNGRTASEGARNRCAKVRDDWKKSKVTPPLPRRDPLALDLDGDGIETVAASAGVLFDHDGNGIKTASGWVKDDDGLLVLDRNGNGTVDNGGELFGVDTVLANGQKATDGFQALSELDSNGDGRIDAADAAFQNLKVWRDIDQDGVTQADEMYSLANVGISSISLTRTTATQDLGNGNQSTASGSFTRSDGTTGAVANLSLGEDLVNSEFVDVIPLSAEAAALPSMGGMGLVRSLSEVATLSPVLLSALSQYAAATSVYDQRNLLDQLVGAWAGTAVAPSQGVSYDFAGIQHYVDNDPLASETQAYQAMLGKLHALEIFNADSFVAVGITTATLQASQVDLLNQGYDALKSGIYDSLISQTLLKPYFDAISFVDGDAPHLDYSASIALLDQKISTNPSEGLAEAADLYRLSGGFFGTTGWNIDEYFGSAISAHSVDSALSAVLASCGIAVGNAGNNVLQSSAVLSTVFGGDGNDSIVGGTENATIYGGAGSDTITDGGGSDTIDGGAGDDVITDGAGGTNVLRGGDGNDTITFSYYATNIIDGGAGDDLIQMDYPSSSGDNYVDTIAGGAGNDHIQSGGSTDTYLFNRGDGNDTISDADIYGYGATDKLVFGAGIAASDIEVSRLADNLVIKVNNPNNTGATDQITIENWDSHAYRIEQLQFADGTVWTADYLSNRAMAGTNGADILMLWSDTTFADGTGGDDIITSAGYVNTTIYGGDGNDTITGSNGDDVLYGGTGNDTITDNNGSDTIDGGAGDDVITDQGAGTNVLLGGDGNDTITFSYYGTNIVDGGAGDDLIQMDYPNSSGDNYVDTIAGGAGNDRIQSGGSTDTYLFNRGDGQDTISDADIYGYGATDKVVFGTGISASDLTAFRTGDNLVVKINDPVTADQITIENWFTSGAYRIESFVFADGSSLTDGQMTQMVTVTYGTAGADTLNSWLDGGTLLGLGGNDTITFSYGTNNTIDGGAGDDLIKVDIASNGYYTNVNTFTGGVGNDRIESGGSTDTYVFNRGDGQDAISDIDSTGLATDTMIFGAGIAASDLALSRSGYSLVVKVNDPNDSATADQITIENWFSGSAYQIEGFAFADGSSLTAAQLTQWGNVVYGTAGADTLTGWSDGGTVLGLDGNDTITDSNGSDTIDGGAGDDVITDQGAGANVLLGGTGNDSITFSYYASNTIEGGAGDDLIQMDNAYASNDGYANTFAGGTGNDRIQSGGSADTYLFNRGDGQDTISDDGTGGSGPVGMDTLVFGAGIVASDLLISHFGNDLIIRVTDSANPSANDRITIENWDTEAYRIEQIRFADGTTWDSLAITANISLATQYADTYKGSSDADTYNGLAGDDQIYGFDGNDSLAGGAGNDLIDGGVGDDAMAGGAGDDTYIVDIAADTVTEVANEGLDTVHSSVTYSLAANVENLVLLEGSGIDGAGNELANELTGNQWSNLLSGGAGNDTLVGGGGHDTLDGGVGADSMLGGSGDDSYVVDETGDVISENADEGIDTVQSNISYALGANLENLTLLGTANLNASGNDLNNILVGNSGNNVLIGGAGNDVLLGMSGADILVGGTGDDTYIVDGTDGMLVENVGEGQDTVQASVGYSLGANLENLTLTGSGAISGTGNALDNVLLGNYADNLLTGGAGNDTLEGGYGNDSLIGGTGNDLYYVDSIGDIVTESAGEGLDTVRAAIAYTLSANVENLELLEAAGAVNATGNGLDNVLAGNSYNNTLNGGAGADTLIGGVGNDTYTVDNSGDTVVENAGEGTDVINSSASYTMAANVENLTLTGTSAINGSGNDLNNLLTGNSAANMLSGGGGNDSLNGGTGADTLIGGLGDDTYTVDNIGDLVVENAGEGTDVINSSVSYTLAANVENLTLTGTAAINGTGNASDNVLTGNTAANTLSGGAGNDILNGGTGADSLIGGLGDDTYTVDNVGDVVVENADEGTDSVNASISYTLAANVENLTLTGTAVINGTGNASDNALTGNSGANTLSGGAGNDILNGGAGADSLVGGLGDDTYTVDNVGDTVVENAGGGTDTVQSSIGYTLATNLENLTLSGTAIINGTGNAVDNVLVGNSAANVLTGLDGNDWLDGSAGNDSLVGGTGDDTYVVAQTADIVTENANEGIDTVRSSITWALGVNLENLVLTGASAITGIGNGQDNIITGNTANNTLSGGTGADTLIGGLGNDTYTVDNVGDVVVESAGEGTDIINSAVSYTLAANVENLTLTGTAVVDGTGNALDNLLTGNSAANTLSGGGGNDSLNGGTGADTLIGGAGNDSYTIDNVGDIAVEAADEGTDTVNSSVTCSLGANIENLVLTAGNISGTGNGLDNVITGSTGNNTLTGNAGHDTLDGRAGTDILVGGTGSDTYLLGAGYGSDTIRENDATAGNSDLAQFLSGIGADQVWLRHLGNNLEASVIGTTDKLTVENWYLGSSYHVEQFKTADGKLLLDSQVENLVQAMAAFAPPGAGQTTLPPAYQDSLAPVIAVNWQ